MQNRCRTALVTVLFAIAVSPASRAVGQVEHVDPTIGNVGILLVPTRPAVFLPNSMVRVYPVRKDQLDDQIHSFPLTIVSHRLGELFWLMPSVGISRYSSTRLIRRWMWRPIRPMTILM